MGIAAQVRDQLLLQQYGRRPTASLHHRPQELSDLLSLS